MLPDRVTSKPQYVLHPLRALRRAQRLVTQPRLDGKPAVARLPWGLPLTIHESDAIGYSILVGKVFDPCVTETIHRLVAPGDLVVDIGANVGYVTSLAAVRAGTSGRVVAVEPHPAVFELLQANVADWAGHQDLAPVELHQLALSDHSGAGTIVAGPLFEANMGLAKLSNGQPDGEQAHDVELRRLDELLGREQIGLLKVDVEGHEAAVLAGASELLKERLVREIIFEDHDDYPSAATEIVEAAGYRLVSLGNDLGGLRLKQPRDRGAVSAWPGPSYLATVDPKRSFGRLEIRGWQAGGIGIGRR